MFSPLTPPAPNILKSHPPTTAPTTPRMMSRKKPSPDLFTILLPIKPATRPSTIHARIDIVCSPQNQGFELQPKSAPDYSRRRGPMGIGRWQRRNSFTSKDTSNHEGNHGDAKA